MENAVKPSCEGGENETSKLNDKINMEAYQAYYNTNEASPNTETSNA